MGTVDLFILEKHNIRPYSHQAIAIWAMVYSEEEVNPLLSSGPRRRAPASQVSYLRLRKMDTISFDVSLWRMIPRHHVAHTLLSANFVSQIISRFSIAFPAAIQLRISRRNETNDRLWNEYLRRARAMLVLDQNWTLKQYITKIRIMTNHGSVHLELVAKTAFGSIPVIKSGQSWRRWFGF